MPQSRSWSLHGLVAPSRSALTRFIADDVARIAVRDLDRATNITGAHENPLSALRDRAVLISTRRQFPAVLAAVALDGIAGRILLCPPDIAPAHLPGVLRDGGVDVIVSDDPEAAAAHAGAGVAVVGCGDTLSPDSLEHARDVETEWVLFTSGTTGRPKMVVHTLPSLVGPLDDGLSVTSDAVWSTFYDVRRYGGLQILLRALVGGGSMVLSSADEPVGAFLARAGETGVTHISGTPSHWRRALMSAATQMMTPGYVRLSGEIADQAVLDSLRLAYPDAQVAHAFASTEAGVAFDVRDNLAGFPAALIDAGLAKVEMRIQDGSLRIRSSRTAARYLGDDVALAADQDGFIDTGDMIERRGDRYYFVGRKEGVINVGGQKVHPEEVEAVINDHPAVQLSRVSARANAITGAIVVAEIVRKPGEGLAFAAIRTQVLDACRARLAPHKVPVTIREVPALAFDVSGKLARGTNTLMQ